MTSTEIIPLWVVAIWCPITAPPALYHYKTKAEAKRHVEKEERKFAPTGMSYQIQYGPVFNLTNVQPIHEED